MDNYKVEYDIDETESDIDEEMVDVDENENNSTSEKLLESKGKIDRYGLGSHIVRLRKNLSMQETADIINKKYLPDDAEPINRMTISRYERWLEHNDPDYRRPAVYAANSKALDPWLELRTLKARNQKHMQRLNGLIADLHREDKLSEVASISNAYLGAVKQHQAIINDITKYQERLTKVDNVRRVMATMMTILKQYPEVWNEFLTELKKHEEEYRLMSMM